MASIEKPGAGLSLDTTKPLQRPEPLQIEKKTPSRRSTYITLAPLPCPISPSPRYIAGSAASQIITNYYDARVRGWISEYGIQVNYENIVVDTGALKLMNQLLDQLLFNFLFIGKSAGLSALRPAILEVLRTKLATDAMVGADDELHDYLGTDDPALLSSHIDPDPEEGVDGWDAIETWKRTRLRCMVYSSLGEMEEEDEDRYMEQLRLDRLLYTRQDSRKSHLAAPAVAIFLTAILEHIGERALIFASKQAYHRLRIKAVHDENSTTDPIIIKESDMDKVSLDRTLGRLWRNWRKSLRSPPTSATTARSVNSFQSREYSPTYNSDGISPVEQDDRRPSIQSVLDQDHIASIPLPISEDDIREIEIPGLAYYKKKEENSIDSNGVSRSASMLQYFRKRDKLQIFDELLLPPQEKMVEIRKRSNSLPPPSHLASMIMPDEQYRINSDPAESSRLVGETGENGPSDEVSAKAPGKDLEQPEELPINLFRAKNRNVELEDRPMSKDSDTAEQYYVERPKIMTSHRVSVSMGTMSPDGPSRPSSIHSPTLHSIRLIDVPSRSPSNIPSRSPSRPNRGSVDATTPILRSATASPFLRTTSDMSKNSSQESILEEDDSTESAPSKQVAPELKSRGSNNSATSIKQVVIERAAPAMAEPELGNSAPSRPAFVLAPAPVPQRRAINSTSVPDYQTRNKVSDTTMTILRPPAPIDPGVPPLTPLREMMEIANDTSDEASSIAPSLDSRSLSEKHSKGHTPSISVASIGQSQRNEQHRRPVPPERSVHRTRKDSMQKSSEIVNRSNRSISQSSSATSHSNKLKPIRTSSDYGDESKGKTFEELIRSDQTIQYTLTPQNMREIEALDSPRVANPPNFGFPNDGVNGSTPPRPGSSGKSINKFTGLHSNPPSESPMPKPFSPVTRPASNHTTRSRPGAPQARDARIEQESIGDFADFIRSTGPTGLSRPPPRTAPSSGERSVRVSLSRNASISHSRTGLVTPVRRSNSSAGRTRLLAREAKLPHSDNNSDLIDFIRQGPPSENTRENPRIPRTVAPFRTTMDSDQMTTAIGGRAFESVLPDARSSNTSTNIPESMNSSVNSQSALLNGTNRKVVPARSHNDFDNDDPMPKRKTRRVFDPYAIDSDDDEDDEELFNMSNKKPQRQEESLMDFLNNVPPPPSAPGVSPPKPKATLKKKSSRGLIARFTRTPSSSNISASDIPPLPNYPIPSAPRGSMGSRSATNAPQIAPQHPYWIRAPQTFSGRSGTSGSTASTIKASSRSEISANEGDYTTQNSRQHQSPPSVHHQLEKPVSYQPARGNYVSQLDTERKPPSTMRSTTPRSGVTQRSYQPREATQRTERVNDLADFFMNAPPPPTNEVPPEPFLLSSNSSINSGGSFSKMFRKKKAVGYA